jgi:hypothetical protein
MGRAYLSVCVCQRMILVKKDETVDTLMSGRLPDGQRPGKPNFKRTTVERFELGKGDLGGALPRSELTGSEARSDDPRVGSVRSARVH